MSTRPDAPSAPAALYAIGGAIEPTRLSLAYRSGLVVVAIAMLLLPLVYVALIGLVGYGTWWHLTADVGILSGSGGRQWRLLAYLAPAIVGAVVTFFMIKPLLARPAKQLEPTEVDPEREPVLWAFVHQICSQVGAPTPRRVLVDCQVNASAGLGGVFSRDLTLTIGLPLTAGLSVRELGGVLAHEFGHFAQGGGMRLTAVVRGINGWFARVVYERDAWDERLERYSKELDWRLSVVLALARGAVWLSRRVLHGLMLAGHAISCFMMRQMEYDADSYEVKLAGVEAFARTSVRLRELGVASQLAYVDLRDGLNAGAVPSDLPALVASRLGRIPADVTARIRTTPADKSGMFDTHPSDADRLRAAAEVGGTGVLVGGDASATQLFAGFEALCAAATRHHYEHDLGLEPDAMTLVSADTAAVESHAREERRRSLYRIFGGCLSGLRPLQIPPMDLPLPELVTASEAARATMSRLTTDDLTAKYRQLDAIEEEWRNAVSAESLFEVGFTRIEPGTFGLKQGNREEATRILATAAAQQNALAGQLVVFEQAAVKRLACGLALPARPPAPDDATPGPGHMDHASLVTAFNAVSRAVPAAVELRRLTMAAAVVEATASQSPDAVKTQRVLSQLEARIQTQRRAMQDAVSAVAAPPGTPGDVPSLAALCGLPANGSTQQASTLGERIWTLYFDLLGRIAGLALHAEQSLMTEPIAASPTGALEDDARGNAGGS